jgi:hypothetical protein
MFPNIKRTNHKLWITWNIYILKNHKNIS